MTKKTATVSCTCDAAILWQKKIQPVISPLVHIYIFNIAENVFLVEQYRHLLKQEEKEKSTRFYQEKDTHRFLLGRILSRLLLARYNNCKAEELSYTYNKYKKPFLNPANSNDFPVPFFNWSHTGDALLIAVGSVAMGIDIEQVKSFDVVTIMPEILHPLEIAVVQQSPQPEKDFFRFWTRKEAFLKATGNGLIDQLNLLLVMDGLNQLVPEWFDTTVPYSIKSFDVQGDYIASVCYTTEEVSAVFHVIPVNDLL